MKYTGGREVRDKLQRQGNYYTEILSFYSFITNLHRVGHVLIATWLNAFPGSVQSNRSARCKISRGICILK